MEHMVYYDEIVSRLFNKQEVTDFIEEVLAQGGSIVQIMEPYRYEVDRIVHYRYGIFWKKPIK